MPDGDYELTLTAECGSRAGVSAHGRLALARARRTDASPRTGETAPEFEDRKVLLYGWTDLDFGAVGAIVYGTPAPPPTSRDPIYPGVLVVATSWFLQIDPALSLPRNAPMMLIGTNSNSRMGALFTDGSGIALLIEAWRAQCYRGRWDAWGIVANGAGAFKACRASTAGMPPLHGRAQTGLGP